jgi:hypothetical protein
LEKLICEYCKKEKQEISFMIGASVEPDWCMHEGTGKVSCPDCYPEASAEAQKAIDEHYNLMRR